MQKPTLGVIVGNRGFFPDHLCHTGRQEILRVMAEEGVAPIILEVSGQGVADVMGKGSENFPQEGHQWVKSGSTSFPPTP